MYILIVFLPLYSFIILNIFGSYLGQKGSIYISLSSLSLSLILTCFLLYEIVYCKVVVLCKFNIDWISINLLQLKWGFLFDTLSIFMLLIIILISLLVHIYSISYMESDPYLISFISYLSLFTFFMVLLVTSDNFIQMFIGWEGVGFVSFLLISFWSTRIQAVKSSIKAVIMNRIGDLALILSFLIIYKITGTLEYLNIFLLSTYLDIIYLNFFFLHIKVLDIILILIILGCIAKSAQIGLHTWLPDAMEGPTPVSALLHAATMVTAGIYLTLRCSPLLIYSYNVNLFIIVIGSITAIMAASIAIFQDDIKKIIAYSTCSQLGYMFFSCGLMNYEVAFFHLINHAFFKALLFLSAGSIIHSLNDEQDLKKMGGLINLLPFTYNVLIVGSLAIMGFPYLTGFYSKDTLIELIIVNSNYNISFYCTLISLLTALFTNIYSLRIIYLVFLTKSKFKRILVRDIHDSPFFMLFSQLILAFFSIFIGFFFFDMFIGLGSDIWNGSLSLIINNVNIIEAEFLKIFLKQLPFIAFLLVCILVLNCIYKNYYVFDNFRKNYQIHNNSYILKFNFFNWYIYQFLSKKWFFDIFYNKLILNLILICYKIFFKFFERGVLEYLGPLGVVYITNIIYTNYIKYFNTGLVYHYSYVYFSFSLFITIYIILF